MFTCMIVDDQPGSVDLFRGYIEKTPFLSLRKVYTDPLEALSGYDNDVIDLVFIGFTMAAITGPEFVDQLKVKRNGQLPKIVFLSDSPESEVAGSPYEPDDFIRKPLGFRDFEASLKRILEQRKMDLPGLDNMDFFFAESLGRKVKIKFDTIYYVEAAGNYVTIVSSAGKITIYKSMYEMEALLPSNHFLRIHKSYLVSLDSIHAITKNEILLLLPDKSVSLPIGLTYKDSLLKKLKI